MADVPPTQGYQERAPHDRMTGKNTILKIVLALQVSISIIVLGLSLALIATQPLGTSTSSQVNYVVFVTIFSLLSWFFIFVFAQRFDHLFPTRSTSIVVGSIAVIFYLAGALALTVAIAPGGSCTDPGYLMKNKIIAGMSNRCRTIEADVALIWLGTFSALTNILILSTRPLSSMRVS
jgi:hypothetical protein